MFFAFGLFDGKPVKKGEKYARCGICRYEGIESIFARRKWAMIFIPFPVKNYAYLQCPRCGAVMPLSDDEYKNISGR